MRFLSLRSLVVLLALAMGLVFVYAERMVEMVGGRTALLADTEPGMGQGYVADLDFWQRTQREQRVYSPFALDLDQTLDAIPLSLGAWQGKDVPQSNIEVFILLEPEQYVQRLYEDGQGHYIWLSLIGGRTSRTFHPPDLCYTADGWQTLLTSTGLPLPDGSTLHGAWMEAQKADPAANRAEPIEHLVFYVYLFPDQQRNPADGMVLLKLTTPRYGSIAETKAIHANFLGQLLLNAQPLSDQR
jgi:hypothetical protein